MFQQFDTVIEALKAGKEIDLSNMPEPPDRKLFVEFFYFKIKLHFQPQFVHNISIMFSVQEKQPASSHVAAAKPEAPKIADPAATSSAPSSGPPPAATTILEALEQRLQKYEESALKAKEEGNSGKARRMGRITKVSFAGKNTFLVKVYIFSHSK